MEDLAQDLVIGGVMGPLLMLVLWASITLYERWLRPGSKWVSPPPSETELTHRAERRDDHFLVKFSLLVVAALTLIYWLVHYKALDSIDTMTLKHHAPSSSHLGMPLQHSSMSIRK